MNRKGFSFIELIIALAISMLIISALGLLISQSVRSYSISNAKARLETNIDNSLSFAQSIIYNAQSIRIYEDNNGLTLMTYDSDNNLVGLRYREGELFYLYNGEESFICNNLTDFNIKINKDSIKLTTSNDSNYRIDYIADNLMIDITIKGSLLEVEREVTRSFATRNSCKENVYLAKVNEENSLEFVSLITNATIDASLVERFIDN